MRRTCFQSVTCAVAFFAFFAGCGQTQPPATNTASNGSKRTRAAFQTSLDALAKGEYPPQHSLLIFQDGKLALEKYWDGPDLLYGRPKDQIRTRRTARNTFVLKERREPVGWNRNR